MIPGDKLAYPGTSVLINKHGIQDADRARSAEYKFAAVREFELRANPIPGKFDLEHLQAIHRYLFQDMYEWAGQPREVDFAKYNKATGLVGKFTLTPLIPDKADEVSAIIQKHNGMQGLKKPEFVNAISEVYQALNEMHPFREGNGRSGRIFLTQLAQEAGYTLDFTKIDKERWNDAAAKSMPQYNAKTGEIAAPAALMPLRGVFQDIAEPTIAHVFKVYPRDQAVQIHPELAKVYERLDAVQKSAEKIAPNAEQAINMMKAARDHVGAQLAAGVRIEQAIKTEEERKREGIDEQISLTPHPLAKALEYPREQTVKLYPELDPVYQAIDVAKRHAEIKYNSPEERAHFVKSTVGMFQDYISRTGTLPPQVTPVRQHEAPAKDSARPPAERKKDIDLDR